MADYIPITEAQSDPEAAVDSSLIKRLRDNPLAIAEGAVGAPKVQGISLDNLFIGRIDRNQSTSPIGFNDLDRSRGLLFIGGCGNPIEIRFSNDNGASYGSYQTFLDAGQGLFAVIHLSLLTGRTESNLLFFRETSNRPEEFTTQDTRDLSVPSGVNAFQIRGGTAFASGFRFSVFHAGGKV